MERVKCTIEQIQELENGLPVEVTGLIRSCQIKQKTNGEEYAFLTLCDSKSETAFPIWDNLDTRLPMLKEGALIKVLATINEYNGNKQLKPTAFVLDKLTDENIRNFIPSYDFETKYIADIVDILSVVMALEPKYSSFVYEYLGINTDIVSELVNNVLEMCLREEHQVGEDDFYKIVLPVIPKQSKFYKLLFAPAAVHHHQNKIGGCFLHTYNVVNNVINILKGYENIDSEFYLKEDIVNKDRLVMCAILHDIEKTKEYSWENGIKRNDVKFDHRLLFIKESEKVNNSFDSPLFDEEELTAIQELVLTHHGPWGGYKPKTLEGLILFCADWIDANVASCIENNTTQVDMKITRMIDSE